MIIGIVGFISSGKGTIADILCEKYNFRKVSFADPVKDAVSAIFGWNRDLLEGDTSESREFREKEDKHWTDRLGYSFSPRLALQMMGTEAGRQVFHSDLWIHALDERVHLAKTLDNHENFVIPDVRFPNEIDYIHSNGGFVIRSKRGPDPVWFDTALQASGKDHDQALLAAVNLTDFHKIHYSEWAWIGSEIDYTLHNDGTIDQLEADLNHCLKVFQGPDTIEAATK